jgi:hypothetical protein
MMGKPGRPSTYNRVVGKAVVSMLKDGDTIDQICVKIGVAKDTFYLWCERNIDFQDEVEAAKDHFFKYGAERALCSLIKGTSETRTTKVYKKKNRDTGEMEVRGEETTVIQHPPDYRAVKFTLHNRFRNKWNKPIATQIDITKMPTSQLQELAKECLQELEGNEADD